MGKRLRAQLRDRLSGFASVYGITLTVDGALFESPYHAWLHVMKQRCLSRLVEKLHRRGFLNSRAYFWVVEFQRVTLQPHWHLLVDSSFIPFGEIVVAWSSFRPNFAPKLKERVTLANYKGQAPAFGSVRFTLQKVGAFRAAGYACKYLIKVPSYGFPDWVLDHEGNVPRYGRSRGFFPSKAAGELKAGGGRVGGYRIHPPDCFCVCCQQGDLPAGDQRRRLRTLRERIAECGQASYVTEAPLVVDTEGGIQLGRSSYVKPLSVPYAVVQRELGTDERGQVFLSSADDERLHMLEHEYYQPSAGSGGEDYWE